VSNELTLSVTMTYKSGKIDRSVSVANLSRDVSGAVMAHVIQNVGSSEEALDLSGVAAGGYVFMRNLDATNFISVRQATSASDLIRLDPGDVALFRLDDDATAPFVIADTAACDLEFWLLSD
jgi:hypothetical protein